MRKCGGQVRAGPGRFGTERSGSSRTDLRSTPSVASSCSVLFGSAALGCLGVSAPVSFSSRSF